MPDFYTFNLELICFHYLIQFWFSLHLGTLMKQCYLTSLGMNKWYLQLKLGYLKLTQMNAYEKTRKLKLYHYYIIFNFTKWSIKNNFFKTLQHDTESVFQLCLDSYSTAYTFHFFYFPQILKTELCSLYYWDVSVAESGVLKNRIWYKPLQLVK